MTRMARSVTRVPEGFSRDAVVAWTRGAVGVFRTAALLLVVASIVSCSDEEVDEVLSPTGPTPLPTPSTPFDFTGSYTYSFDPLDPTCTGDNSGITTP